MAKIYVIDSENVGDGWVQLLTAMSDEDKMYVFYTDKSPYISYESLLQVIAYGSVPRFVKCHEGRNALDFQLVSELGYMLAQMPSEEFVIVSDDNGFDAVVRYWSEKDFKIRRIGRKFCRSLSTGRRDGQNVVRRENSAAEAGSEEGIPVSEMPVSAEGPAVVEPEAAAPAGLEEVGLGEPEGKISFPETPEAPSEAEKAFPAEPETAESARPEEEMNAEAEASASTDSETAAFAGSESAQTQMRPTADAVREEPLPVVYEVFQPQKSARSASKKKKPQEELKTASKTEETKVSLGVTEETKNFSETEGNAVLQDAAAESRSPIQKTILDIVNKCKSLKPEEDAKCVYELFFTVSMATLTEVNSALKTLIGNEEGNDIYRELKEHHECRQELDELYLPTARERFLRYVQIVLDRSELKDLSSEELGKFLLKIPRKNLNSIRSSMQKEYGTELGSMIYTVYKPHIKVLNKIM